MAERSGNSESQRNGHGNPCRFCGITCNSTCSRCGEFYCSKECQTVDWREHKYYCFEMPELIEVSPQQSNNGPRFRSDNRRAVQNLRNGRERGEYRDERAELSPSEKRGQLSGSRHSNRSSTALNGSVGEENERPPEAASSSFKIKHADPPKNNDEVVLTFVKNANCFYIRTYSSTAEYDQNAKDYDECGRNGMKLQSMPQKNDVVLVRHDDKFHRGLVVAVHSDSQIDIGLLDVGRKICQPVHELRQISDELKNRERFNFIVTLGHLPKAMDPKPFGKLHGFVRYRTSFNIQFDGSDWASATNFKLLAKDSGLPIEKLASGTEAINGTVPRTQNVAEPIHSSNAGDTSINGTAVRKAASTTWKIEEPVHSINVPEAVSHAYQPILFSQLPNETLPNVANLHITDNSLISTGCVSAVTKENLEKLSALHDKVQNSGDSLDEEVYRPKPNELCLVKFQEEWYRAMFFGESAFLFIDWGPLAQIDERSVRKLPEQVRDPCFTFGCRINGFRIGDAARVEQLKEVLKTHSVQIGCVCVPIEDEDEINEYNITFPNIEPEL